MTKKKPPVRVLPSGGFNPFKKTQSHRPTQPTQPAQPTTSHKKKNQTHKHQHQRQQQQTKKNGRQQRSHDDDDGMDDADGGDYMDEDEESGAPFVPTTAPRTLTLDMIANPAAAAQTVNPAMTGKNKRKRKQEEEEEEGEEDEDEDEDEEEEAVEDAEDGEDEDEDSSVPTTASFAPPIAVQPSSSSSSTRSALSSSTADSSSTAATSISLSTTPTPAFAPAATGTGALFSNITPALDGDILHVLHASFGFHRMTPVQQQTIPTFLKKDVAVQSYTGSGKTLSFVLPMLQILINKFTMPDGELLIEPHTIGAIILSPTRELATQICTVIAPFVYGGEHASEKLKKFRLAQFIGGSSMSTVELDFTKNGGNIIVATPGRLNSTMGKLHLFNTKELRVLILDEADRLLDEGFEQDITDILRKLPKQRRTGLFSATQTRQVKELRRAGLQEKYAKIDVLLEWKQKNQTNDTAVSSTRTQMTPTTLHNYYTVVRTEHKLSLLVDFICRHAATGKLIIFFLTGDEVEYFSRLLTRLRAIYSRSIHKKIFALRGGKQGMDQTKRNAQFQAFVKESNGILLATDVAARGIDVPDVDWIIQYDPPKDPSVFVHRIGRTARMGKSGSAIVYLTPEERGYVELIQNLNVPIVHEVVKEELFEAATSWKEDTEIGPLVKLMEEGKATTQVFEQVKKRQHQHQQSSLSNSNGSTKKDSKDVDQSDRQPGSIRNVLTEVKYLCLEDRFIMEKAQRAYTSFIDGYKQHVLTHVLNYQRLPFGDVAQGMGLLYLPKMPDIKHLTASIRYDRAPIAAHFIKFKDSKLQAEFEKKEALIHEKNQQEQLAREKKLKDRQKALEAAGPKRKKKAHQLIREEWDELQNENRLLKKLKQGKITKKEFEIAVGERKKKSNGEEKNGSDDEFDEDDSDAEFGSGDSEDDMSDDSGDDEPPSKKQKGNPTPPSSKKKGNGRK